MDTLKLKFAALALAATLTLTAATVTAVTPATYAQAGDDRPILTAAAQDLKAARAIGLAF